MPTILVTDDDSTLRELVRDMLLLEGYTVRTAADGREALECVDREQPDLVLCDVFMPRLDGWSFAGLLRQRARPVPIVMMSGRCPSTLAAGLFCLNKPFAAGDLLAAVARALG
jgi:CheY-like chemotaxis protein